MLELLNQLDGFDSKGDVKVILGALLENTVRDNSSIELKFNPTFKIVGFVAPVITVFKLQNYNEICPPCD